MLKCLVLLRERKRIAGNVDLRHGRCAAGTGKEPEAAGVAEAVEDIRTVRKPSNRRACVALIKIKAGLVSLSHIDEKLHAVLGNLHQLWRLGATENPKCRLRRKPFLGTGIDVAPLRHALAERRELHKGVGNLLLARVRTSRGELADDMTGVAVRDNSWDEIVLGVHETNRRHGVVCVECGATSDGLRNEIGDRRIWHNSYADLRAQVSHPRRRTPRPSRPPPPRPRRSRRRTPTDALLRRSSRALSLAVSYSLLYHYLQIKHHGARTLCNQPQRVHCPYWEYSLQNPRRQCNGKVVIC